MLDRTKVPSGAWLLQDHFGEGVGLEVEGNTLSVLLSDRGVRFTADGEELVVWKMDRLPFDLRMPQEKRRTRWWLNDHARNGDLPCDCRGYPNLGIGDEVGWGPVQCIVCGWADGWDDSLIQARESFAEHGLTFRSGDDMGEGVIELRHSLVLTLDGESSCRVAP